MHYKAAVVIDGGKGFRIEALEKALAPFEEHDGIRDFDKRFLTFHPVDCREGDAKYYEKDPVTGEPGYYVNPNGKWDSWELWRGCPIGHEGFATPEDLDEEDADARMGAMEQWHFCFEDGTKYNFNRQQRREYMRSHYGSKESFVYYQSHYIPFAFIDEDGKWHDQDSGLPGFIGEWEAMVKRLKGADCVIVMVDCHI